MKCDDCAKFGVCKFQTKETKEFVKELEDNIHVHLDLDNEGDSPFELRCNHFMNY